MDDLHHTLGQLRVGDRVVVRYALAGDESPRWSDALGYLVAQDADALVVDTRRHGEVRVARAAVVAAKTVPPPPVRR